MHSSQPISVISTFAIDKLIDENGELIAKQSGGPALFIERVLRTEGVTFKTCAGGSLEIEILVTAKGEFSRLFDPPTPSIIKPDMLGDCVIVSSIAGEWQLAPDLKLPEKVFIDIQGFVRDGNDFGAKKVWPIEAGLARQIFCLKGTAQEVRYLPPDVLEGQKQRLLIVTNGKNGIEVFYKGRYNHFDVGEVRGLKDTIGAGDTFLAHCVAAIYRGATPANAVRSAIEGTSSFLIGKLRQGQ